MSTSAVSSSADRYPPRDDLEAAFRAVHRARVPQIPDVVHALRDELARPEPNLKRAADLIAQDLAITGQVLKAINSPLFASRAKIGSVKQAVMMTAVLNFKGKIALYSMHWRSCIVYGLIYNRLNI